MLNLLSQSEVKLLGKFSHPNLVRLLGYCWEENQFLLVYEYMQKGSLEKHLFRSKKTINPHIISLLSSFSLTITIVKSTDSMHRISEIVTNGMTNCGCLQRGQNRFHGTLELKQQLELQKVLPSFTHQKRVSFIETLRHLTFYWMG